MPRGSIYTTTFVGHQGKVSDKWTSYLKFYDEVVDYYEGTSPRVLEIGVQNGGSLEIWSKIFPNSEKILGVDINDKCASLKFDHPNTEVITGNALDKTVEQQVLLASPTFDLIVDDGSHNSSDIIDALVTYLPRLNPGGIYVIEDLHASYWHNWDGGLSHAGSSLNFLRKFIDLLNKEHWGLEVEAETIFPELDERASDLLVASKSIASIEFRNSICCIKLAQKDEPTSINPRFVTGVSALVETNKSSHKTLTLAPPSIETQRSIRLHFDNHSKFVVAEELNLLESHVANQLAHLEQEKLSLVRLNEQFEILKDTNERLNAEISELNVSLNGFSSSLSWRITSPIRFLGKFFRRGFDSQ
jgi:SAM-dependent methyltransferase